MAVIKSFTDLEQSKKLAEILSLESADIMVTAVENSFYLHCGQMTDRLSEQYKKFFEKVKSIRPQSTWKPSDGQIIALRWVLNNVPYNKHKEEISGLLDQIKDL